MVRTKHTKARRDESANSRRRLNFVLTGAVHSALAVKCEQDGGMTASEAARRYIVEGLRKDGLL